MASFNGHDRRASAPVVKLPSTSGDPGLYSLAEEPSSAPAGSRQVKSDDDDEPAVERWSSDTPLSTPRLALRPALLQLRGAAIFHC